MINPTLVAKRIAEMNEWAKMAQAESFEVQKAECMKLSNDIETNVPWYDVFGTQDVDSDRSRCIDNIDTASLITEVNGIVNRLALAQTSEEQRAALNKFNKMLINLNTPRGEDKIARAPKAVQAWVDKEAKLPKEERLEFGTHNDYKKEEKRKANLFKGKALSLSGGVLVGLILAIAMGGK